MTDAGEAHDALPRYGGLFGGLIVAAPIGGLASRWMIGERGVPGPLVLLGDGGAKTAAAAIIALALLVGVAIVVARLINSAVGMFVLGCGLGVLAMRCGTVGDIFFGATSPATMAIETLLWAGLVAAASRVLFAGGGWLPDVRTASAAPVELGRGDRREGRRRAAPPTLVAIAASVLVVPVVWLVLRNDLKGQALAATTIGAMVAGLFARLWAPTIQPWFVPAAAVAAMGVAQLVAAMGMARPLLDSFIRSDAPRVLAAMPIDIAAGALAGAALGFGWSRSFAGEPTVGAPRAPAAPTAGR